MVWIGYLAAWIVFTVLGFRKIEAPPRQVGFSLVLLAVAIIGTWWMPGILPGVCVFGVGTIATLVRMYPAWRELPPALD
ncbi:hypothetical protein [Streptomyces luteireticuli]|uniref:DUF2484 family protein n=1 Tax=Streptomyces luteireticuli TaxID=173858 RepID=A0ABP3IA63_9ACTN